MCCPFLREGRARYCHASPVRKLILDGPGAAGGGRCTTPEYRGCALVEDRESAAVGCPHMEGIHVQYCGASPVAKLVPFSESQLSRCTSAGFRFCDSYLALARPRKQKDPPDLFYAPNHMWLDVAEDGLCHIGADAFLAGAAGAVDSVTFVTTHGAERPAVSFTVNGVQWPLIFPNPLLIHAVNAQVRIQPRRVTADPYGSGWLFEGWELPGRTRRGLIGGSQAGAWLAEERERLARYINDSQALGGDGGYAADGVAQLLPRPDLIRMLQQFFSNTSWGEEV